MTSDGMTVHVTPQQHDSSMNPLTRLEVTLRVRVAPLRPLREYRCVSAAHVGMQVLKCSVGSGDGRRKCNRTYS